MKRNKKGFTIIELVVVIAVIAILAAVLIPTFSSIIKKANTSADIQAVQQMNTQLAIANADKPITNISDAIVALGEVNIKLENYQALTTDRYFYFVFDANGVPTIIYADESDNKLYPENVSIPADAQWMSLSGSIPMDSNYTVDEDGKVSIDSGAKLAHLIENFETSNATEIALSADIDLKGAAVDFGKVSKDVTLDGNNHTLSGIREDSNATTGIWQGESKDYGFGLFGKVPSDKTVTVKNITVKNVVVRNTDGDKAFGHSGILFGSVAGKVEVSDVTIDNCTVVGGDKVGSLIGYLVGGEANINNVTVKNTSLYGLGWIAKAVGYCDKSAKLTMSSVNCDENVTTGINEEQWSTLWWNSDKNWITDNSVQMSEVKAYIDGNTDTFLPYIQNSDTNQKNHLEGMTTQKLAWVASWTQVTVENKTGYQPMSTDTSYSQN